MSLATSFLHRVQISYMPSKWAMAARASPTREHKRAGWLVAMATRMSNAARVLMRDLLLKG
jgi:hypothetical protein